MIRTTVLTPVRITTNKAVVFSNTLLLSIIVIVYGEWSIVIGE